MKLFRFLSLVLNNFLIKRWSTPKVLKKAHCRYRSPRIPILCSSRIFYAKFLYQLRRNDVYNFRVIATTNELHSPIGACRENSPEDLLDRSGNLFPILNVPGNKIHADDTRAKGNPDSDRLRLKGSLALSFAMYRSPLTIAVTAITSPLSDLTTLDSITQFSLRLLFFIFLSLTHSLFSFSSSCTLNEEGYKGDVPISRTDI